MLFQPLGASTQNDAGFLWPDAGSLLDPSAPLPDTSQPPAPPAASDEPKWWDVWGKLKAAVADLDKASAKLELQRGYALNNPALSQDFLDREDALQTARDRAAWLRDAIKSVMGFFGVQLSGARSSRLGSLGFLPLITIGVAAAAVAYIAKEAADTWALSKRIDEQQRLEQKGLTPQAAASIVTQQANAGSFTQTLTSAKGLIIAGSVAGGLYMAYRVARRMGLI